MLDYSKERKYTVVGFCSGTIAGLVAATPSSGFVPAWGALIIGIVSGVACNYATKRMCKPGKLDPWSLLTNSTSILDLVVGA